MLLPILHSQTSRSLSDVALLHEQEETATVKAYPAADLHGLPAETGQAVSDTDCANDRQRRRGGPVR